MVTFNKDNQASRKKSWLLVLPAAILGFIVGQILVFIAALAFIAVNINNEVWKFVSEVSTIFFCILFAAKAAPKKSFETGVVIAIFFNLLAATIRCFAFHMYPSWQHALYQIVFIGGPIFASVMACLMIKKGQKAAGR